jgi:hypothetical protein
MGNVANVDGKITYLFVTEMIEKTAFLVLRKDQMTRYFSLT